MILRFSGNKDLLLDGLLDKGGSIAEHAVVVNAHLGQGSVLLFGNNPIYRGETIGDYALVFNAILNHDHLAAAAAPQEKRAERSYDSRQASDMLERHARVWPHRVPLEGRHYLLFSLRGICVMLSLMGSKDKGKKEAKKAPKPKPKPEPGRREIFTPAPPK